MTFQLTAGGAIVTRDTIDTFVLKVPDEKTGLDKTIVVPPNMRIIVDMVGVREYFHPHLSGTLLDLT